MTQIFQFEAAGAVIPARPRGKVRGIYYNDILIERYGMYGVVLYHCKRTSGEEEGERRCCCCCSHRLHFQMLSNSSSSTLHVNLAMTSGAKGMTHRAESRCFQRRLLYGKSTQ